MIFPSYIFLFLFLPIVLCFWLSRMPLSLRLGMLTLASYVFYGWWDYRFVSLLLISTIIDYACGKQIARHSEKSRQRPFVILSIAVNLGLLGFFKYADFFVGSLDASLSAMGITANLPLLHVILPIGISFYTFQSMSYSVDLYRGHAKPAPDFLHFAAYVSLFPQLVAGPIVRYSQMSEQVRALKYKPFSLSEFNNGVWFFVLGLAKKILIADKLAPFSDRLFDGSGPALLVESWVGSLAYTLQLYFDFSGYSDMAIGLGFMLGFTFPINFNSPYKARDIAAFWNRWHISLSTFLRDYLFIPLGGSRGGLALTLRNLLITMFLGGLWHGAQWTFVVWGLYHGVLLALCAIKKRITRIVFPKALGVVTTFLLVHLGWVLFRAPDFSRAKEIFYGMAGLNGSTDFLARTYESSLGLLPAFFYTTGGWIGCIYLIGALCIAWFLPNTQQIKRPQNLMFGAALGILMAAVIAQLGRETPFLYFQF